MVPRLVEKHEKTNGHKTNDSSKMQGLASKVAD